MPEFNNMRFNENLLGRLIAAKRTGNAIYDDYSANSRVRIMSTIQPLVKFNSYADWMNSMKDDAKLLIPQQPEH